MDYLFTSRYILLYISNYPVAYTIFFIIKLDFGPLFILLQNLIDYLFKIDIKRDIEGKTNIKHEVNINYRDHNNINLKIISNNTLLSGLYLAKNSVLKKITSKLKFDIMQSNLSASSIISTINQRFLTNAANEEHENTRDICIRISQVDNIYSVINEQFALKARSWQISVFVDIILKQKNMCANIRTNVAKSVVYLAILIVPTSFVFIISPIIAFIKDQIRAFSKYCYYISL